MNTQKYVEQENMLIYTNYKKKGCPKLIGQPCLSIPELTRDQQN